MSLEESRDEVGAVPDALPPLPVITPENEPYWASCRRKQMQLQRCSVCGQFWFPPSAMCPRCWSDAFAWADVAGTGRIVSFVRFQRVYDPAFQDLVPYLVAVVELSEGPRMLTRLVNVRDAGAVTCGMPVAVCYETLPDGTVLPLFAPEPEEMKAKAPW